MAPKIIGLCFFGHVTYMNNKEQTTSKDLNQVFSNLHLKQNGGAYFSLFCGA